MVNRPTAGSPVSGGQDNERRLPPEIEAAFGSEPHLPEGAQYVRALRAAFGNDLESRETRS